MSWQKVNQELVAKAIGELTFEELLSPVKENDWALTLQSGIRYTFTGWQTIWGHLRVNPQSLTRNSEAVSSAAQFFIDSQIETGMDEIVLANFLEEMHNSLSRDMVITNHNDGLSIKNVAELSDLDLQSVLNGHPKILLNKGRIGWGESSSNVFSPESKKSFRFLWLAVDKSIIKGRVPENTILDESFSITDKENLLKSIDLENFALVPVHPWQWDRFISIQFAALVSNKQIIFLGEHGDEYRPQVSLRTLSNVSRPEKMDIKVPLSILNTSCIRGLPSRTITLGTEVSGILKDICKQDHLLREAGTDVLCEKAGIAIVHPGYSQLKDAPYRYHEYLGAIWRESLRGKLQRNEKAVLTASLYHQDSEGKTLLEEFVRRSGLSKEIWLKKYFNCVVIPLYHLQLKYGVGMVAHGQNIVLKLHDYVPVGMYLKDFQGDLRLSSKLPPEGVKFFGALKNKLTTLPPHYLIHDLITGHFVTVLRFLSGALEESHFIREKEFYGILRTELQHYQSGKSIPLEQNLLSEGFAKLLLNKVRFKIGYSDSSERPLPIIGTDIRNPLLEEGLI